MVQKQHCKFLLEALLFLLLFIWRAGVVKAKHFLLDNSQTPAGQQLVFNRHLKSHIWKQNLISDCSPHPTCFLIVLTCSAMMWLFNTLGKTLETMIPPFFLPQFTFSSPDGWLCLQNNVCLYNTSESPFISSNILWESLSGYIELIELGSCSL